MVPSFHAACCVLLALVRMHVVKLPFKSGFFSIACLPVLPCNTGDDTTTQSLLSLPPLTLKALAAAAVHLSSFGLDAVLKSKRCLPAVDGQQVSG